MHNQEPACAVMVWQIIHGDQPTVCRWSEWGASRGAHDLIPEEGGNDDPHRKDDDTLVMTGERASAAPVQQQMR